MGNMLARSLFGGYGGYEEGGEGNAEPVLLEEDQPCYDLQQSLINCLQTNEENFQVCEWPAKAYQQCYEKSIFNNAMTHY